MNEESKTPPVPPTIPRSSFLVPHSHVAGWKEYADFPLWKLRRVKVKLDTGARTAALGIRDLTLTTLPDGTTTATFTLALYRRRPGKVATLTLPVVGFATVRHTGGAAERRPVVEAVVRLGPVTKTIRATLADRSRMLVPVILGRSALAPEFAVHPGRKFLLSPPPRGAACGS